MHPDLWTDIADRLGRGLPLAVATIVTSEGSAPRGPGAKMLVDPDGIVAGTLGGGLGEARAEQEALEVLRDGGARLFAVDMTGSARDGADLICGGVVHIFVQRLEAESAGVFQTLRDRLTAGLDTCLLTPARDPWRPFLALPEAVDDMATAILAEGPERAMIFTHNGSDYILEPVRARFRLVLAGGGHVSLATARMADAVDFDVTVLDDRDEFVAPERFSWLPPGRLIPTPGFLGCLDEKVLGFPVTERTCVAILTRGHAYDSEVLAQALATRAGYIGMIGSRRKREMVYEAMAALGYGSDDLARVHSPIGLAIGAETPEEIAVSIVAELIASRAATLSE